jgi:hypothetical protein
MSWDEQLFALFDDLEQQAEGAFGIERDLEVAERAQAEYAVVTLASRLMASLEHEVVLEVTGVGAVSGTLRRVGDGWCLVEAPSGEWLVRHAGILAARGLSVRSVPEEAWPASGRLGFGSALRRVAAAGEACRVCLADGSAHDVLVHRIGADFVEARAGDARAAVVFATAAIAAVQQRSGDR